ncbi:MAG: right-handed parallel beta-helix repeat-containing protein, partial [Bryobacteraceae bacterium]
NNGVLANKIASLEIEQLELSDVVNFPILISQSSHVRIAGVTIDDSGSKDTHGRNNLSGGILLEEGTTDFEVRGSTFRNILGNALWTHSNYRAPRQRDGVFTGNKFDTIGRDAIQVGHATRVRVNGNTGVNVGYPIDIVDIENQGTPVAIDTAGNVDNSTYARNDFKEINGQCIDLDGFHDGTVQKNTCTNSKSVDAYPFGAFAIAMNNTHPDAHSSNIEISGNVIEGSKFGGLFLMGSRNRVIDNVFLGLNLSHGDEPEMLASGIYLSRGLARLEETAGNVIRGNRIVGYKMKTRCIVFGPGVVRTANTLENNSCSDDVPAR